MDMDAVSHDKDTRRFLFQEFKEPGEPLHPAQRMVLRDLAGLPRCTAWFVRRLPENRIGWAQFGSGRFEESITVQQYQEYFRCWWDNRPIESVGVPLVPVGREPFERVVMRADEIPW